MVEGDNVVGAERRMHLEMNKIKKSFAGVEVLHGVDLNVLEGEVHALVGENGAGKSTLMKILAGDLSPDEGTILVQGAHVVFHGPLDSQRAGIAMIHQELSYVGALSVAENLMLGRLPKSAGGIVRHAEIRSRARKMVADAGIDIDVRARMDSLSLSQRQVVEILRAVDRQARLIVMDEPTSSLTAGEVRLLFKIIERVKAAGVSVVYISHHLDEIFEVADRVTVLRDGRQVATTEVAASSHDGLVRQMVGTSVVSMRDRDRTLTPGAVEVLEVRDLSIPPDVSSVDFDIRGGEILALYGLVGAGQERIARALYGLELNSTGSIRLGGDLLHIRSPKQAIEAGIGFVPSDRKVEGIVPKRGVRENITYPSLASISRLGVMRLAAERQLVDHISQKLAIKATSGQLVGSLSGGNQQKVVVSRWFARPIRLLILSDPTRGVDVRVKAEIHTLIRELANDGVSILVVSGDLPEVVDLADRISVIRRGAIVRELIGAETSVEEVLGFASGGSAA